MSKIYQISSQANAPIYQGNPLANSFIILGMVSKPDPQNPKKLGILDCYPSSSFKLANDINLVQRYFIYSCICVFLVEPMKL